MKTFPVGHNPENRLLTPGYRWLSTDEPRNETDETWGCGSDRWITLRYLHDHHHHHPINGRLVWSIRRAICIDDPYAPPPSQWLDGYEMIDAATARQSPGSDYWCLGSTPFWRSATGCAYGDLFYYRRPVGAPTEVPSHTPTEDMKPGQTRRNQDGSLTYVTQGQPKRPTTLAPNQSIVISVGSSAVLSRAVQEAAFAAGFTWEGTGASVLADVISGGRLVVLLLNRRNQHVYWQLATAPLPSDWSNLLHLDARTDMGLLIDLLSAPSAPKPIVGPTINGYVGAYTKGADIIVFGCAQISVHMLRALSPAMMSIHGNRTVASMTLSSGVTITREQIAAILSYIDQVNKG